MAVSKTTHLVAALAVCLAGMVWAAGCRSLDRPPEKLPPLEVHGWFDHKTQPAIRRIVVLPFENQTRIRDIPRSLARSFAAGLHGKSQFEVVSVNQFRTPPCPIENIRRGDYPLQLLVDMYRHHNADAVLFASVDQFHPYDPMVIGVTLYLVDTREATVVAWASGLWSMADPHVAASYRCYVERRTGEGLDHAVLLRSPTVFGQFVVDLVMENWMRGP